MAKMLRTVKIESVVPNRWRDFALYPIDQEQVARLVSSIEDTGFWMGLQGRHSPNGKVELAAGHHRLEAAKSIGIRTIDMDVADLDDEQMLKIMTVENATQRGHSSAAIMDSVNASVRSIALKEYGEGGRILPPSGRGDQHEIGWRQILASVPRGSLTEVEVKAALAALKESGHYAKAIDAALELGRRKAQSRLEEIERQRKTAEEEERRAAEEAGKRQVAAEAAAKAAEEAHRKAQANKAKQEELAAKRAEEVRQKAALKRQQDEEKVRQQKAKQEEAARNKEKSAAQKDLERTQKADTKADQPITLDLSVANLFKNNHQFDEFRKTVTDSIHSQYIRVDQQRQVALDILAAAKKLGRELTAAFIRECVANLVRTGSIVVKKAKEEDAKLISGRRLEEAIKKIDGGMRMALAGVKEAVEEMKAGAPMPEAFDEYLGRLQFRLESVMSELRNASGIREGSQLINGEASELPTSKLPLIESRP